MSEPTCDCPPNVCLSAGAPGCYFGTAPAGSEPPDELTEADPDAGTDLLRVILTASPGTPTLTCLKIAAAVRAHYAAALELTEAERGELERIEHTGDTQGLAWRVQQMLAARLGVHGPTDQP